MRVDSTRTRAASQPSSTRLTPEDLTRYPWGHTRLGLDDLQPGAHQFNPVVSAIIDQLLPLETTLAAVKKLVENCVL
jgi:hypothetical protein